MFVKTLIFEKKKDKKVFNLISLLIMGISAGNMLKKSRFVVLMFLKKKTDVFWKALAGITDYTAVTLLGMMATGVGFRGVTPFRSKNRWKPEKKVIAVKLVGFRPRNMWSPKRKKKIFAAKLVGFRSKMRTEKRSSPQISGDMVSLHNMMSPQNGDTRVGPLPP